MRTLIIAILLTAAAVTGMAGRNTLLPSDFEPLTSLPWKKPGATLEGVLGAIFRETNPAIRYPVLAEYLRTIPVGQLGKAFDICIDLEGAQTPDDLIEFFLPIWAKRDPKGCWKRTRELIRLVGIENGWLGYDSWKKRPRITVQDLDAIRASRFWIEKRESLTSFPLGLDESSLPRKERIRLMKEFADVWFGAFGTWPGYHRSRQPPFYFRCYAGVGDQLIVRFADTPDSNIMSHVGGGSPEREAEFEVALRRWLEAEPNSAIEIIKQARDKKWPPFEGQIDARVPGPSIELLLIWARADMPAIVRWAESLDIRKDEVAAKAKGMLMSRVDIATRERWLADAKSVKPDDDYTMRLLSAWAAWDPKPALEAALATNDAEMIMEVVSAVVDGPFGFGAFNSWHYGLGVLRDFDVAKLPKDIRHAISESWSQFVMEAWGEIDVAGAARHGLDFMLVTEYAPREGLIRFFSGYDEYPDEGSMIDRTFCALRVWAVVKPGEMKAWIATLKDAEMRKALTWLLQHPWGTGPKE